MNLATLPKHIAIIPDGNTRWAKQAHLPVIEGYRQGAERGLEIMRHVRDIGIHTLTFWGLSTENWRNRPKGELDFLVKLFGSMIDRYLAEALTHNVRVIHLGNKTNLPKGLLDKVQTAEQQTKDYSNHILNLALDYGGHDELLRATRAILADVSSGKLNPDELMQIAGNDTDGSNAATVFARYLDTASQPYPYPDFVIRTSGEMRTSGFMPWQMVYSELYFEPALWPDFTPEKLDLALASFSQRERRFGGGHNNEEEIKS